MECVIFLETDFNAISSLRENEIRILNVQNPTAFNEKWEELLHTWSLERMELYLHIIKDLNNLGYF